MLALVIISFTEVGRKIVISINSTVGILFFGHTIPIEVIKTIYRCFFICFIGLAFFILRDVCKNKSNKKKRIDRENFEGDEYKEFESLINNGGVRNIWITGSWGTGKTKFVTSMLDKMGKKYLYVSLFGLNSRKDIIQEINNRIIQETKISILVNLPVIGNLIQWFYSSQGIYILRNYSEEWILVFDDFERVSNTIIKSAEKSNNLKLSEFESYNEALGVIDYIEQIIGCRVIVISSKKEIEPLYKKIIIPKFSPREIKIDFNTDKFQNIVKENLTQLSQTDLTNVSTSLAEIWRTKMSLENKGKDSFLQYRPFVKELSELSNESNVTHIISYSLSRLIEELNLDIQITDGELIAYKLVLKLNSIENPSKFDDVYKLIKNLIQYYGFENSKFYYVSGSNIKSKKIGDDRITFHNALVNFHMDLALPNDAISDNGSFNDDEISILMQKTPVTLLMKRLLQEWFSDNYLEKHYFSEKYESRSGLKSATGRDVFTNITIGNFHNIIGRSKYKKDWQEIYYREVSKLLISKNGLPDEWIKPTMLFYQEFSQNLLDIKSLENILTSLPKNISQDFEKLLESRVLYNIISPKYPINESISMYLVKEFLLYFKDIDIALINNGNSFDYSKYNHVPLLPSNKNSVIEFENSDQGKFEEQLYRVSLNTSSRCIYPDEKDLFKPDSINIKIEHLLFIVMNLSMSETIGGKLAKYYIMDFFKVNKGYDWAKNRLRDILIVNAEKNEFIPDKKGILLNQYHYDETVGERYQGWVSYLEGL